MIRQAGMDLGALRVLCGELTLTHFLEYFLESLGVKDVFHFLDAGV
jgi:hypothetical protein